MRNLCRGCKQHEFGVAFSGCSEGDQESAEPEPSSILKLGWWALIIRGSFFKASFRGLSCKMLGSILGSSCFGELPLMAQRRW